MLLKAWCAVSASRHPVAGGLRRQGSGVVWVCALAPSSMPAALPPWALQSLLAFWSYWAAGDRPELPRSLSGVFRRLWLYSNAMCTPGHTPPGLPEIRNIGSLSVSVGPETSLTLRDVQRIDLAPRTRSARARPLVEARHHPHRPPQHGDKGVHGVHPVRTVCTT